MLIPLLTLALLSDVHETAPDGQWTISYTITRDGPMYEYTGLIRLDGSVVPVPCITYSMQVPSGGIVGCFYYFDPYTQEQSLLPAMPFDSYTHTSTAIEGTWCAPAVLEEWQSTLRNFRFSLRKDTFNADDLSELLSQWGTSSSWDLNGNCTVDGPDIALMLGRWEPRS